MSRACSHWVFVVAVMLPTIVDLWGGATAVALVNLLLQACPCDLISGGCLLPCIVRRAISLFVRAAGRQRSIAVESSATLKQRYGRGINRQWLWISTPNHQREYMHAPAVHTHSARQKHKLHALSKDEEVKHALVYMRGHLREPSKTEVSTKALSEFVLPAEALGLDRVSQY